MSVKWTSSVYGVMQSDRMPLLSEQTVTVPSSLCACWNHHYVFVFPLCSLCPFLLSVVLRRVGLWHTRQAFYPCAILLPTAALKIAIWLVAYYEGNKISWRLFCLNIELTDWLGVTTSRRACRLVLSGLKPQSYFGLLAFMWKLRSQTGVLVLVLWAHYVVGHPSKQV